MYNTFFSFFRQKPLFQQIFLVIFAIHSVEYVIWTLRFMYRLLICSFIILDWLIYKCVKFCTVVPKVLAYTQVSNFGLLDLLTQTSVEYLSISLFVLLFGFVSAARKRRTSLGEVGRTRLYPGHYMNTPNTILTLSVFASAFSLMYVDDLIGLALAWVSLNVSLYVLMLRDSVFTAEATLKYFTLGAVATGLMFFGIFLHVVEYGSVDYCDFNFLISRNLWCLPCFSTTQGLAAALILVSFLFKMGVYPFHFYLGDVYEGVRYETLAVITLPVKYATYFAMLNFVASYGYASVLFQQLFTLLGLGSLLIGSYGAFTQQKLRRFWAYSYISSMGFVFLGFQSSTTSLCTDVGTHYFLVYLFTWFTIMLLFLIVNVFRRSVYPRFELYEVRYVSQLNLMCEMPSWVRLGFHSVLLSLAGVPPTLGFFAKFFVLASCMEGSYTYIPLLSVLVVLPLSAYNYLRLVKVMSFQIKPITLVNNEHFVTEGRMVPLLVLAGGCVLFVTCLPFFFYLFPFHDVNDVYFAMYGHMGLEPVCLIKHALI